MAKYNVQLGVDFFNAVSSVYPSGAYGNTNVSNVREFTAVSSYTEKDILNQFIRLKKLPAEYASMRLTGATLQFDIYNAYGSHQILTPGAYGSIGYYGAFTVSAITSDWFEDGISFNSPPATSNALYSANAGNGTVSIYKALLDAGGINNILRYGFKVEHRATLSKYELSPSGSRARVTVNANTSVEIENGIRLLLELEDNIPWVEDLSPAYGLLDASGSVTYGWTFRSEAGVDSTPKQKRCVLQWRGPDGVIHDIEGGADSRLSVPGGVMPLNVPIQWRVKVTGTNDVDSEWSEWINLQPLDRTPAVVRPAPQSGYVDDSRANDFSWDIGVLGMKPSVMPKQTEFQFEWRGPDGVTHPYSGGSKMAVTIPGGSFPFQQPISWRVRIKSDDGLWSAWTDWYYLTTVPIRGGAVAISPDGEYLSVGGSILFVWMHASPAGQPQTGWEIEYTPDLGREWTLIASGEGSIQRHTLTDHTLQSGLMYWRVRTKDETGAWGDWSAYLENFLRAKPNPPTVNAVPNETRPLITWQAEEQYVYQLEIRDMDGNVVYDSRAVASEGRQHQVTDFIASGQYIVAVRVQNQFSDWSDYGERVVTITLDDIGTPRIECAAIFGGVSVRIGAAVADAYHILYRNEGNGYIPIARLEPGTIWYKDYACAEKLCRYFVRAVKGTSYADSRALTDVPDIRYMLIALASKPHDMVAVWYRRRQKPERRETVSREVNLSHFQGRALPVAEFSEALDREHSFTFSIAREIDPDGLRRLLRMVEAGEVFIVRDQYGRKFYAVLPTLQVTVDRYSGDFTLIFQQVDYLEAIAIE